MAETEGPIEQINQPLLLTEMPGHSDALVQRYMQAQTRYRSCYNALRTALSPQLLSLVDQLVWARRELDACAMTSMQQNHQEKE